ncbi:MAG: tetratricopeptide repeat protein [Flavobacteriales bacterium]|jgi:tetratricopeptide (TPR) repeat protein
MKKTIFLSFSLLAATTIMAQPSVTNAYNANKEGDFAAAAGYIEEAIKDPKASTKEKTWRYRGEIYLNIASDPNLKAQFPDAIQKSKESFFKNRELDKFNDYQVEVKASLARLQQLIGANTDEQLKAKDFCGAAQGFESMAEISNKFDLVDTSMIFNSAYCYDQCGKYDLAVEKYRYCAGLNYNLPETYRYIADVQTRAGKKEDAVKTLAEARAKYPNDSELLRSEVNIYLGDQEYAKAEQLLVALTEKDPKNEMFWYVLGITYDKLGKKGDEEKAYQKAIEMKPNYYDARFNLGALYFNQGLENDNICNEIPPRETAKYNDCTAQSVVLFKKSVEHLENAYNNIPASIAGTSEERQIITALKDAYYKAGREEDYKKMKDLLAK